MTEPELVPEAEEFIPKGAILFFLALIFFFGVVWLGLYAFMVGRN